MEHSGMIDYFSRAVENTRDNTEIPEYFWSLRISELTCRALSGNCLFTMRSSLALFGQQRGYYLIFHCEVWTILRWSFAAPIFWSCSRLASPNIFYEKFCNLPFFWKDSWCQCSIKTWLFCVAQFNLDFISFGCQ